MTALNDVRHRPLDTAAAEHLHRLLASWQLIADLAFADLLLFVPVPDVTGQPSGQQFQVVGQLRPYTARTLYPDDLVGEVIEAEWHPYVERSWREGRPLRSPEPVFIDAEPVRVQAVPVRQHGDVVAVLSVEASELPDRPTGRLEAAYVRTANALLAMVAEGSFPFEEATELVQLRVGDGVVVLDPQGQVDFASPNAVSAFRRLGVTTLPLFQTLPGKAAELVAESMDRGLPLESELDRSGAIVDMRVIPMQAHTGIGALALCREVTELRRRDRVIKLREATIREVHHRVKNNLQTVASLLRLQARRVGDHPEAVRALEESVRRIGAIALVHETLSERFEGAVDLADVARRVLRVLEATIGQDCMRIELQAEITAPVDASVATPLSVVVHELVTNAVEHGLRGRPGTVLVRLADGGGGGIELEVADDGAAAVPPVVADDGLGLRLVRALVEEELGGEFSLTPRADGGSLARVTLPPKPTVTA